MKNKNIAVWFSCGAASAIAAKKTLELYGADNNVRVLNNPIVEEDSDNVRFLKDVEKWLGCEIESVTSTKFPSQSCVEVWDKRKFMSGTFGAPCTLELKKKSRQDWETQNPCDNVVLGFTYEEKKRIDRFMLSERDTLIPILFDLKITKGDCFMMLNEAGIKLPRIYHMGYPNANCIGCVKVTSATYWNHVRKMHPSIFAEREEQSRRIGSKLAYYKGERIFLDELPEDALGRPMKDMNFECGIFCEEQK